mmetsp:Transcript_15729/g.33260  ORF Transcript_15729/g.33260 Transcript_15729/m.33260 type:complete len:229 (-) Transcript_15729:443-1129(-)
MVMGATSAGVWEDTIFPDFSRQIKAFVGEKVHRIIASDFSTTTNTARASHEIALMSAMKNYLSFGMSTLCGIPRITLLGSEQDWVALCAEELDKLMSLGDAKNWMPYLLPVLDEFVNSYQGNVNHGFWQSMVKLRNDGMVQDPRTSFLAGCKSSSHTYVVESSTASSGHRMKCIFTVQSPKTFLQLSHQRLLTGITMERATICISIRVQLVLHKTPLMVNYQHQLVGM